MTQEADLRQLVEETIQRFGAIDLFCSNAGIFVDGGVNTPDATWKRILDVNFMAHILCGWRGAAGMLACGGYLLQTASAAGLHRKSKTTVFFWQRKLHGHRRVVWETGRQRTWYAGVIRVICMFDFYLWW